MFAQLVHNRVDHYKQASSMNNVYLISYRIKIHDQINDYFNFKLYRGTDTVFSII
jgi:hypothetical protein